MAKLLKRCGPSAASYKRLLSDSKVKPPPRVQKLIDRIKQDKELLLGEHTANYMDRLAQIDKAYECALVPPKKG